MLTGTAPATFRPGQEVRVTNCPAGISHFIGKWGVVTRRDNTFPTMYFVEFERAVLAMFHYSELEARK